MPLYLYTAKDIEGHIVKGKIEAGSPHDVFRIVKEKGLYLLKTDIIDESNVDSALRRWNQLNNKQLAEFAGHLWLPLETGVSINIALSAIYEQTKDKKIKSITQNIIQHISEGTSLSRAMDNQKGAFPHLYISMVKAGESSGNLSGVLKQIEEFIESDSDTVAKFRSAMIYPFIMLNLSVLVVLFLIFYVLPKILFIFKGKEQFLPLPTKILLGIKDFGSTYPIEIIVGISIMLCILFYSLMSPAIKSIFDRQALKIPIIGRLITQSCIARTFSSMSVLLKSGIPILKTIEIIIPITNNIKFKESWVNTIESLKMGSNLSDPMKESGMFEPAIIQMVHMSEKTGSLDDVLAKISARTLKKFDRTIQDLSTVVEPLLLIIMGAIIGFISMAIVLPLFSITQALSR